MAGYSILEILIFFQHENRDVFPSVLIPVIFAFKNIHAGRWGWSPTRQIQIQHAQVQHSGSQTREHKDDRSMPDHRSHLPGIPLWQWPIIAGCEQGWEDSWHLQQFFQSSLLDRSNSHSLETSQIRRVAFVPNSPYGIHEFVQYIFELFQTFYTPVESNTTAWEGTCDLINPISCLLACLSCLGNATVLILDSQSLPLLFFAFKLSLELFVQPC